MPAAKRKRILIIGATSGIAEHCARRWLATGSHDLVLVARDEGRLQRVAQDLRVRDPGATITTRLLDGAGFIDAAGIERTVAEAMAGPSTDIVLIAHGSLPDQAACERELAAANDAMLVNAVSPALFAEAVAGRLQAQGHGTLAIIGSVAGDRGRRSNYVYGAAKGLLARYAQGLQHRLAATPIRVVCIKPGPTSTAMTAHLAATGASLASVETVAATIVRGIARGGPVLYVPGRWALVMQVIRHLPSFVFNRMDI